MKILSFFFFFFSVFVFFFQAEDGIRDIGVTGVQTCALPIYSINRKSVEVTDTDNSSIVVKEKHLLYNEEIRATIQRNYDSTYFNKLAFKKFIPRYSL